MALSVASDEEFAALTTALGIPDLLSDQRFGTLSGRHEHAEVLDAIIAGAVADRDAVDVEASLQAVGVAASAVATPRDVWFDAQLKHRGFFELVPPPDEAPDIGPRPHLRPAWKLSETPSETRSRAPRFGEHTRR